MKGREDKAVRGWRCWIKFWLCQSSKATDSQIMQDISFKAVTKYLMKSLINVFNVKKKTHAIKNKNVSLKQQIKILVPPGFFLRYLEIY